jgi:hypothetical protein
MGIVDTGEQAAGAEAVEAGAKLGTGAHPEHASRRRKAAEGAARPSDMATALIGLRRSVSQRAGPRPARIASGLVVSRG